MKVRLSVILATLCLFLAVQAQAGTWRSSSGRMFHFYPGGAMEAYDQGQAFAGRWWWTQQPYQFQYSYSGATLTVNIKGQGAICSQAGFPPTYWTQIASRGGKMDKPDTTSWFMEQIDP